METSGHSYKQNSHNKKHDPDDTLCPRTRKKIKRSQILEEAGRVIKADLRRNPWKVLIGMTPGPVPGLMSSVFAGVMGYTVFKNASCRQIRGRFVDVANAPINPKLYENELEIDPETGLQTLKHGALSKRHKNALKAHAHHLLSLNVDRLPFQWMRRRINKMAKTVFKFYPPAVMEDCSHAISAVREAFRSAKAKAYVGPVFALACLSNMPAEDIATHLHGRDREMYLQEYSTLAL